MKPGDLLANQYELSARLGKGGMGEVWRARDRKTREDVAVKVLLDAEDEALQKRFLREARAASAVKHANVVEVRAVGETESGAPFLVMELLAGETLGRHLRRKGVLSVAEAAAIFLPVFDAVEAAHAAGLVHRDLKPENVYLARDPNGNVRVRVLDFGIAKQVEKLATPTPAAAADATAPAETTAAMLGTPYYMAPEQALGERDIDGRADVWSLGVVLYECFTGKRPTEAATLGAILKIIVTDEIRPIRELLPDLDPALATALGDMLRSSRDARAPSLEAIRAALATAPAVEIEVEEGPRVSLAATLPAPRPRARWPWLAAVAVVLGAVGLALSLHPAPAPAPIAAATTSAPPPAVIPVVVVEPVSSAPLPAVTVTATHAPVRVAAPPKASAVPGVPSASGPARGPSGLVTDNPFEKH